MDNIKVGQLIFQLRKGNDTTAACRTVEHQQQDRIEMGNRKWCAR